MITANDLLAMNRRELSRVLDNGHSIDPNTLDDREYCGVSLGLPAFIERLTWKTFKKVFHRDPESGVLRGWNVRIVQDGLHKPYVPMKKRGRPHTFGHFRVLSAPRGLMLDYGAGDNPRLDPVSAVRDPLVAVNAGSSDLLLGRTYLQLGGARVPTPSFFSLERDIALSHVA